MLGLEIFFVVVESGSGYIVLPCVLVAEAMEVVRENRRTAEEHTDVSTGGVGGRGQ